MNDTRSKLAELFKRLTDPALSDLDALADFVWFRKLALSAEDVSAVLPAAPAGPPASLPASMTKPPAPGDDGPMWPFKKKHAGESIAHIARTDPEYLRYAIANFNLRDPLLGHVKAALATHGAYKPNLEDT